MGGRDHPDRPRGGVGGGGGGGGRGGVVVATPDGVLPRDSH